MVETFVDDERLYLGMDSYYNFLKTKKGGKNLNFLV